MFLVEQSSVLYRGTGNLCRPHPLRHAFQIISAQCLLLICLGCSTTSALASDATSDATSDAISDATTEQLSAQIPERVGKRSQQQTSELELQRVATKRHNR